MNTLDAQTWLADHRDYLFRAARRQVREIELRRDEYDDKAVDLLFRRDGD